MKRDLQILSMLALFGALDEPVVGGGKPSQFDPSDTEQPKRVIPAGCKEYSFYGHTVIALNEKTARRKCKKLAGINPSLLTDI